MKKALFTTCSLLLLAIAAMGQRAELHIVNTSTRNLTIKVMQVTGPDADALYSILSVGPNGSASEYFAQTGNYYLKTKGSLDGTAPVYTKGNPFKVYVGADGYSVLTVTYAISESNAPNPIDGKRISETEFELN